MNPIRFPGYNEEFGRPEGWNEEKHGPAKVLPILHEGELFISVWEPTAEERAAVAGGANIMVTCRGAQVPVVLTVSSIEGEPADQEARYRDDPLGHFLSQCMVDDVGHTEKARDMYAAYLDWCRDQDVMPFGEISFRRELAAEGFQRADEHLCTYRDVRLKDKAGGEDE